ncbi:tRNA (adenosine(37)-N6)-dimethylallyltransferase MiaA [candidate division WOR-3 bacterium]|uniref:tRNA dimethylallyltransferase n=1 Tax=candidate division WOR-3 bacterium TaxID=2052148 RepID=A0A660SGB8_UNCW3|nr:MAG: tRNA (adenosine(37)-N6)-dimethylallyltransferase MiaA [candidate division WOR-3 bacterium]
MIKIPVIIGPTASGKTEIALSIISEIGGEIVLADSRKIYRYLDIGTAKPSYYQRRLARFHMIDICDPDHYFSAGDYGEMAIRVIKRILSRNRIPLIVGGSGLYIEAIFNPLPPLPKPDIKIRKRIDRLEKRHGLSYLYQLLLDRDPEWAKRINPNDRQRIKRGLEVLISTGQPLSQQIKRRPEPLYHPQFIGITIPKERLRQRIETRMDGMLNDGLIEETRWLLRVGFDEDLNSLKTIGYQEAINYLKGIYNYEEMRTAILKNTYNYAKRQLTWFKRFKKTHWLAWPPPLGKILSILRPEPVSGS